MAKATKVTQPRRGEVYLVSLDPTVGAEIRKTRPAVIVQNDPANRRSPVTIVAAVTSQFEEPLYPTEVLVGAPEGGLTVDSVVLLNQGHGRRLRQDEAIIVRLHLSVRQLLLLMGHPPS